MVRTELTRVPTVCGLLLEVIDNLSVDHDFLIKGNVFSKDHVAGCDSLRLI
jgi:glutamine synthetase